MSIFSDLYNHDEEGGVPYVLRRSAICTDHHWAACPSCSLEQWDYFPRTFDRYAETSSGLRFIKVNACSFGYFLGLFNWISLVFVAVALYVVCFYIIKRREVKYDEAQQTTTDYSVAVENPPEDAFQIEKWKDFFSQFGHVTALTMAIDNEDLVRALIERRALMYQLRQLLPPNTEFDKHHIDEMVEQAQQLIWWQKLMGNYSGEQLKEEILKLDERIMELSQNQYNVAEIFITFETEAAQRLALKSLCVKRLDSLTNNTAALPKHLLYEGSHVLNVVEPPEPSAIRWQDLDDSLYRRLTIRVVTSLITGALIICGMLFIGYIRLQYGPAMTALSISALNTIAPMIAYTLTEYESHRSEDTKQSSRYVKITLSMLAFTALATTVVTPFTDTVSNSSDSILYSLYAIFVFELFRGPLTQCVDLSGNLKRHLLGPRVTNRLKLAGLFQGTAYELSERYTNMTNVLFLTFYYATIFPAGYFFGFLTFVIHYCTDKYCVLRVWAPSPTIGTSISVYCRVFIMATVVVLAIVSSYYVAGFPFDNACATTEIVPPEYIGNYTASTGDGVDITVSIKADDYSFAFCNMDMEKYGAFPAWASNQPVGKEWMDKDQANIAWLFGWTSVIALILAACIFFNRVALKFCRYMFFGFYDSSENVSKAPFSEVEEIYAYVPQVRVPDMPMPVLIANVNDIDSSLIGWDDPHFGVNAHNIIYDIPELSERKGIFSEIYHFPPPGKE